MVLRPSPAVSVKAEVLLLHFAAAHKNKYPSLSTLIKSIRDAVKMLFRQALVTTLGRQGDTLVNGADGWPHPAQDNSVFHFLLATARAPANSTKRRNRGHCTTPRRGLLGHQDKTSCHCRMTKSSRHKSATRGGEQQFSLVFVTWRSEQKKKNTSEERIQLHKEYKAMVVFCLFHQIVKGNKRMIQKKISNKEYFFFQDSQRNTCSVHFSHWAQRLNFYHFFIIVALIIICVAEKSLSQAVHVNSTVCRQRSLAAPQLLELFRLVAGPPHKQDDIQSETQGGESVEQH